MLSCTVQYLKVVLAMQAKVLASIYYYYSRDMKTAIYVTVAIFLLKSFTIDVIYSVTPLEQLSLAEFRDE